MTSVDRDGTKLGYDLDLMNLVGRHANVPLIASGGCGSLRDFYEVFAKTGSDAALAASLFHRGELTVSGVKDYLLSKGVKVRV